MSHLKNKGTEELLSRLIDFMDLVPASRLNQFLRKLLICYLLNEVEEGVENCFVNGIKDISNLCDFLDAIDELVDQTEPLQQNIK